MDNAHAAGLLEISLQWLWWGGQLPASITLQENLF